MNIPILLFAIFFLILAYRRLEWAVMILIVALPSYLIRFNIFGLPLTLLEVMIWIVFLVWFLKNCSYIIENLKLKIRYLLKIENCKLKINNRYPFDWELILLLIISFIAAGVSGFTSSSLGIWKAYFFESTLLFIVVLNVFGNAKVQINAKLRKYENNSIEKIIWALAVGALAVSLLAIYQKVTGQFIDNAVWQAVATRRVVSFFGYPNAVGLYLGPLTMVFIGWSFKLWSDYKSQVISYKLLVINLSFYIGTTLLSIFSIYFAKSKGALVGVAAGLVVFGLLAGKKVRRVTIPLVLVAGIIVFSYTPARNLVVQTTTFNTVSGQIRRAGWSDTWKMLKDGRLITGTGLANYQTAINPYHTEGIFIKNDDPDWLRKVRFNADYRKKAWQPLEIYLYPHNIFLNFWSELGLAGLLLFVWIIGKFFYTSVKIIKQPVISYKLLVMGLIGAMTVIVVHGLVDVPYFKNDLAVMFWLLVALLSLVDLQNREIKSPVD